MNKLIFISFILCSTSLLFYQFADETPLPAFIPTEWPKPTYNFQSNPPTEQGFQLGKKLFYDTQLSRDNTISCANCHLQFTGFTHVDHAISHGIDGRKGTRNSPALINLAWNEVFHWDGGVNHLDAQALNPIEHPAEMDNTLKEVLRYINSSKEYRGMFFDAYGDSLAITKTLLSSFSQFTIQLISDNSRFDKYLRNEINFTNQEKQGYRLFQKHCNSCHTEPLFMSTRFASNGLPIDSTYNDLGRYNITHIGTDSMQFRIPTLRNIVYTYPYMHDGRFKKLKDVLRYYTEELDVSKPHLSRELQADMKLSEVDQKDIIAFLYTLTDLDFLHDPRFGFPR